MKPYDLYNKLRFNTSFTKSGDDVDWAVFQNDEEKTLYLAFQETVSKRDWQVNFNFPATVYKRQQSCLKIANGWGKAYKSCNDEIMGTLSAAVSKTQYKVTICGWSYGGAMAILAAEDFYFRTGIKADIITFGAPKPLFGKKSINYVLSCINSIEQYAHINDCVPLMPPFAGYGHLNKIILGNGFNLISLLKPQIYHCEYGNKELYDS